MMNPKDVDLLDTEEGRKNLPPEFVQEMTNNKGDDEEEEQQDGVH